MTTDPSPTGEQADTPGSMDALRAAASRLDDLPAHGDAGFDPGEHAERFDAVHDALVAVLADVEQTSRQTPEQTSQHSPGRT